MAYRRLGVKSAHRRAMLRNATTSLLKKWTDRHHRSPC